MIKDMIEDINNIQIYELVDICAKFLTEPNNEEYINAMNELKQSLNIMSYMPIQQKEIVLRKALIDVRSIDLESTHFTIGLEIAKMFDILLAYVININTDIEALWKDYDTYDVLYISGLIDYILEYIKNDYIKCEQMIDAILHMDNIQKLFAEIKVATPEEVDKLTKAFEEFTLTTYPNALKTYGDIIKKDDSITSKVERRIKQIALDKVNSNNAEK